MNNSIVINVEELKAEIEQFLLGNAEDRLVSEPMVQIGKIVDAIRYYKAMVVAANAPRGLEPGSEIDPNQREKLRCHRITAIESCNTNSGLHQLKEWLISLDMKFVIQDQPWRVQDVLWESKIWSPLFRWASRGFDLLFENKEKIEWPYCIAFSTLEAWEKDELEIETELIVRISEFLPESDPKNGVKQIDPSENKRTSVANIVSDQPDDEVITPPKSDPPPDNFEANLMVKKFIDSHPKATIREISSATGISTGRIAKLDTWRLVMAQRKAERPSPKKLERPLMQKMQASLGKYNDPAARLMEEEAIFQWLLERAKPDERVRLHMTKGEEREKLIELTREQYNKEISDADD
jgi:hypothetical protein